MWSEQYTNRVLPFRPKRAAANPYSERIGEFPGRLFCLDGRPAEDVELERRIAENRPRFVELGSGSGGHIIERAKQRPEANFFGFEIRFKRAFRTIEKAVGLGVGNVYVLRTIGERLSEHFSAQSISGLYINFPDPWPKKKRHKHRLLSPELLTLADMLLLPEGFISVKTDHQEYFQTFLRIAEADNRFVVNESTEDLYSSPFHETNIPTEFEKLFLSKGQPICYLKIVRRQSETAVTT